VSGTGADGVMCSRGTLGLLPVGEVDYFQTGQMLAARHRYNGAMCARTSDVVGYKGDRGVRQARKHTWCQGFAGASELRGHLSYCETVSRDWR